jgi:hypothetical protein
MITGYVNINSRVNDDIPDGNDNEEEVNEALFMAEVSLLVEDDFRYLLTLI